ncbi:MAG: hypothetical protein R2854_15270 [Caldilineaceae bacterium]
MRSTVTTNFPVRAVGTLLVADIGTDPALARDVVTLCWMRPGCALCCPCRDAADSHKGTFGKVMAGRGQP